MENPCLGIFRGRVECGTVGDHRQSCRDFLWVDRHRCRFVVDFARQRRLRGSENSFDARLRLLECSCCLSIALETEEKNEIVDDDDDWYGGDRAQEIKSC